MFSTFKTPVHYQWTVSCSRHTLFEFRRGFAISMLEIVQPGIRKTSSKLRPAGVLTLPPSRHQLIGTSTTPLRSLGQGPGGVTV